MRAVLDESVPRVLAKALGEQVSPFPVDWKGLKNGILLDRLEAAGFDVLITCDASLRFQQSFRKRALGLLILPFQRLDQLLPILDRISDALAGTEIGSAVVIDRNGSWRVEHLH